MPVVAAVIGPIAHLMDIRQTLMLKGYSYEQCNEVSRLISRLDEVKEVQSKPGMFWFRLCGIIGFLGSIYAFGLIALLAFFLWAYPLKDFFLRFVIPRYKYLGLREHQKIRDEMNQHMRSYRVLKAAKIQYLETYEKEYGTLV